MTATASKQLTANITLANGKLALRVESAAYFSLDEAATALAVLFRDQPLVEGFELIRAGLHSVAKDRILQRPDARESAHPVAVEGYRKRLAELRFFLSGEEHAELIAALERQKQARSEGRRIQIEQPRLWNKHWVNGEWKIRVDVNHFLTLDDAALALAAELPVMPPRFGAQTVRVALRAAGEKLDLRELREQLKSDDDLRTAYETYKERLVQLQVFPAPEE